MKSTKTLKDASQVFCPNLDYPVRGKIGSGNIVSHGKERERYTCKMCKKTFGAYQGTMFEGLRKPEELMVIVVTRLSYACPLKRLCMPCTWTNEQWPDGKNERESIAQGGVTRFFRENHTLSREIASQGALSMADLRRMM